MTANHTSKLNLMDPVDSDTFSSSDFSDTFRKIDAAPGIATVDNYAGLQALGWTTAQHGRKVIQLDNLAEWIWINPSGTGSFQRTNTVGLLKRVNQTSDVSTAATSGNGVMAVQTGNIVVPGGRAVHINVYMGLDNTIGVNGMVAVSLMDNGTLMFYAGYRSGQKYFTMGNHHVLDWWSPTPAPNSTHNYAIYIRAEGGSASNGAGGTASCRGAVIAVSEV